MKKNLFTVAALLGVSVMAQGANEVALVDGVYTIEEASWQVEGNYKGITFDTPFDITGDWTLSLTLGVNASHGTNDWGTALLATGTEPFANFFDDGFQLYVKARRTKDDKDAGDVSIKGAGDISGADDHRVGDFPLATAGKYTLNLTHIGTDLTVSIMDAQGTEVASETWNNVTWADGTTVKHFTTTLNDSQLGDGWTLPTGTLTLIPEPTTATLSLLALAGLAARRRRK